MKSIFSAEYIAAQSVSIHQDNRKQGFWDKPRSVTIIQGLIASEMFEAFEGLRKNRYAKRLDVLNAQYSLSIINNPFYSHIINGQYINEYSDLYEGKIKDTVEAEIAGTCIRCLDAIGGWLYEGEGYIQDNEHKLNAHQIADYVSLKVSESMPELPWQQSPPAPLEEMIIKMVPCALGVQTGGLELGYITPLASVADTLKNMALLGAWYNIDVELHIELEVAYNRTRLHMHNGKSF